MGKKTKESLFIQTYWYWIPYPDDKDVSLPPGGGRLLSHRRFISAFRGSECPFGISCFPNNFDLKWPIRLMAYFETTSSEPHHIHILISTGTLLNTLGWIFFRSLGLSLPVQLSPVLYLTNSNCRGLCIFIFWIYVSTRLSQVVSSLYCRLKTLWSQQHGAIL